MVSLRRALSYYRVNRSSDAMVREQYHLMTRQMPEMYALLLINSGFLAAFYGRTVDPRVSMSLPILLLGVTIWRAIVWVRRQRAPVPVSIATMRATLRRAIYRAITLSIALSGWMVALYYLGSVHERPFVPLSLALTIITCCYCLSSLPLAAFTVILVGASGPVGVLLLSGDFRLIMAGINVMIVAGLIARLVIAQFDQLRRIVSARGQIMAEKSKVHLLAFRDELTGLPNRRAFLLDLLDLLADAPIPVRAGTATLMIDLDGFKAINDSYGHATGDGLLVETAARLAGTLGADATLARLAGDEFAVLLRNMENVGVAEHRARTMMTAFATPFLVGDQAFRVSASFGLAFAPAPLARPADLVHRADIALYAAKGQGGRVLQIFAPHMEDLIRRRTMIEQALADDDLRNRITMAFQPIYDARGLTILGFEALARWEHPLLGTISPAEFIPAAERSGMTDTLTATLFRQAIAVASRWPDEMMLSFNLSTAELASPLSTTILIGIAEAGDFDLSRLAVEVTETALLADFGVARTALSALRAKGAQVWLDDFGAGFASIGYLREIAFDAIKLDGEMVKAVVDSADARALLRGVLYLCQAIDTPVIAEMVETPAQIDLLRTLPIAKLQGFYLGKPMTAEQTLRCLEEARAGRMRALVADAVA